MFAGTREDRYQGHESIEREMDAYRAARQAENFQPTVEEYESMHGSLPAGCGVADWTSMDLQTRPYNHSNVDMYSVSLAQADSIDSVPYAHEDGGSAAVNISEPMEECVTVTVDKEPLIRDQRSDTAYQKQRAEHERALRTAGWNDSWEQGEAKEMDTELLNARMAMPDGQFVPDQDPLEVRSHVTWKSEHWERMKEADERAARGAQSVLGRSSYGNYGF